MIAIAVSDTAWSPSALLSPSLLTDLFSHTDPKSPPSPPPLPHSPSPSSPHHTTPLADCPLGSTSIGGSACLAGYECSPDLTLPTQPVSPKACTPGSFSSKGAAKCSLCPAAYYGLDTAMAFMSCTGACLAEIGFYCPEGTNTTQGSICPGGYICPTGGQNLPAPCLPGTYASPGQAVCANATAGNYAPAASATQLPCLSPGVSECCCCCCGSRI